MRQKAIDYKKNIAGKFMLVEAAKIKSRIGGEDFCVTRKIDGHLQCLFYENGEVVMLNSNGKQRATELKCLEVFAGLMKQAGVKSALVAAELYMPREGGRPRSGDVQSALADEVKKSALALAPFDIMELDGTPFEVNHYKQVHARLKELFGNKEQQCIPVEMRSFDCSLT